MNNQGIKWCTYQGMLGIIEKFDVNRGMAYIMYRRTGGGGDFVCVRQVVRIGHLQTAGKLSYYKETLRAWLVHEYEKGKRERRKAS